MSRVKGQIMIEVGEAAPEFTLPRDGEGDITLSALQGNQVVLYFYPKDDTTGCTKEACDFREAYSAFQKLGVEVIGVSPDPVKKHDKFKAKYDLPFPLLSDEEKTVVSEYGVWVEKSMYGRKYMGVERSTFLIGADGKIQAAWRKVKVPGHVDAVMKALQD
jgi:peroxiredoxin Q/BCP